MKSHRRMIIGGGLIAVIVATLSIVDMVAHYPWRPFAGYLRIDLTFLLAAGLILYMAYDAWRDVIGEPFFAETTPRRRRPIRAHSRRRARKKTAVAVRTQPDGRSRKRGSVHAGV